MVHNLKKKPAFFVTFEGTDGVGKSTHIQQLAQWLKNTGWDVVVTREPGGSPISEKIRALILDPTNTMSAEAELYLYQAARADHVQKIILPHLKAGTTVLCDRFTDATIAYQGFGRGVDLKKIIILNRLAASGLKPDLTLWLDHDAGQALHNAMRRSGPQPLDRIEKEGIEFQKKVRAGYVYLSRKEAARFKRVAVQDSIEETHRLIRKIVQKKLGL